MSDLGRDDPFAANQVSVEMTVYGPITAVCEQGSVSNSRRVKRG